MLRRSRLPLHALRAFEAAARHGSFVAAAEDLAVTHGAISHQVRYLESLLDARLFDRTRRPLVLTPAGEELRKSVGEAFDRLSRATVIDRSRGEAGSVSLSCVPGLCADWLVPRLGGFLSTHPNVSLNVTTEHWRQASPFHETDLALVYGSAEHPGKRVVLLGHSSFFPVASPKLVGRRMTELTPPDILDFALLHDSTEETWSRWLTLCGIEAPSTKRGIIFDSAHLSLQAARSGYGIALGDWPTIETDLLEGRLVRLFQESVPAVFPYYLVTGPRERQSPAMQLLEDWIVREFAQLAEHR